MNQKTDDNTDEPAAEVTEPAVADELTDEPEAVADTEEAREKQAPRRTFRVSSVIAWLALLLALVSLAGVGYLTWLGRTSGATAADTEATLATVSGNLDETLASLQELQSRLEEFAASGSEQADEIASLGDRLDELSRQYDSIPVRLASLERSMSSLQGISAGSRDTWLLAEAEYYMQIANAQLQLAGNPELARVALGFADQRIRQLANPALIDVRRSLSEELRALEAMESPDIEGMSMTLASLADTVGSLPLQQEIEKDKDDDSTAAADAGQSGFERALASLKKAFGSVVSVRRTDEAVTPLMSPDAAYFLRANLALQLQTARLALLRGEQAIFEQSLANAADWLKQYYASDDRAVQSALDTISRLSEGNFSVSPPDISESLRLLRQFNERAASEPSGTADEPAQ